MTAAPFRLTSLPDGGVCAACGKAVKDMKRHAGSAPCVAAARRAMVVRLGLLELWGSERGVMGRARVEVTVVRERGRRRWYAAPESVRALRALAGAGVPDKRVAQLLRGAPDELERELAVAALSARPRFSDRRAS